MPSHTLFSVGLSATLGLGPLHKAEAYHGTGKSIRNREMHQCYEATDGSLLVRMRNVEAEQELGLHLMPNLS